MKKLSTLLIALSLGYVANAQIPNAGFENWTAHTASSGNYDTPDDWGNADTLGTITLAGVGYTCEKGTPGAVGSSYIKLTSKASSVSAIGVVPGIAVSGKISFSMTGTPSISSGFPITTRPANLTGQWQYTPGAGDQGSISVLLTKRNVAASKTDTISYTEYQLAGTVSSWTAFSIPLTYQHGDAPDSGRILLLSGKISGGTAGSTLSVDDLAFTGSVPNGVVNVNNITPSIEIYPNPATGYANISYESVTAGNVHISVTNLSGSTVTEVDFKKSRGANTFPIDISKIASGIYFVKMSDENGVAVKKLFVE